MEEIVSDQHMEPMRRRGASNRALLFEPTDVWRAFEVARLVVAASVLTAAVVLAILWRWAAGLVVVAAALGVATDAIVRRRSKRLPRLLGLLAIDITAVGAGMLLSGLPDVAIVAPYGYMLTAAVLVLTPRQGWAIAAYLGVWTAAVLLVDISIAGTALGMMQQQAVVGLGVVIYLAATFVLTSVAAAAVRERNVLDERLEASRTQLRTVVEGAPVVLFSVDVSGTFTLSEGAGLASLGLQPGEVVGRTVREVYGAGSQVVQLVHSVIAGGLPAAAVVHIGEVSFDVRVSPLADATGSTVGAIGIATDVTDQTRAQREIQRSRQRLEQLVLSKDQFVASVSHELRTPLATVLGLAEELRDHPGDFDADEVAEFHQLLAEQAAELAGIVEDLLVVARADIGQVTVEQRAVVVQDEVGAVLAPLRGADRHRIRLRGGDAVAWADASRLRQVVRNVVANALRYGGSRIELSIGGDGSSSTIEVRDDGVGVPEGEEGRIFDPYEHAALAPGRPGSIGLGLTVARQLCNLMGGDLTYERVDGWTVFRITLPAAVGRSSRLEAAS